jgi:hypothetical protein
MYGNRVLYSIRQLLHLLILHPYHFLHYAINDITKMAAASKYAAAFFNQQHIRFASKYFDSRTPACQITLV